MNFLASKNYFCQNAFSNTAFSDTDPLFTAQGQPRQSIKTSELGKYKTPQNPSENYLYEKIIYDSSIELEVIKEDIKKAQDFSVKVFAKLPKFTIPTPYKDYQPDFAYVLESKSGATIFFVCETKGYESTSDIPSPQKRKIDYARRFFESLNEHFKATHQNAKVIFTTRINKQDLLATINQALKDSK